MVCKAYMINHAGPHPVYGGVMQIDFWGAPILYILMGAIQNVFIVNMYVNMYMSIYIYLA